MFRPIVSSSQPITLVGGGDVQEPALTAALAHGPDLVAADGGALKALALGYVPKAVIGDLDSIEGLSGLPAEAVHRIDNQDSTDFEKCLRLSAAPLHLAVGFLGGRLDHQLASINALLKHPGPVILVGADEVAFVAPTEFQMPVTPGWPCGLYPLLPTVLTTAGLKYPLTQALVSPDGLTSTSNTITAERLTVRSGHRVILVTLPIEALAAAIAALSR